MRKNLRIKIRTLLAFIFVLGASQDCRSRGFNQGRILHTPGNFTRAAVGPLWLEVEPEKVMQALASDVNERGEPSVFVPRSSPLIARMQTWVDTIHQELLVRYPEQFKNIPKPHVIIQKDAAVSAYVPIFLGVFNNPVHMMDSHPRVQKVEGDLIFFQPGEGSLFEFKEKDSKDLVEWHFPASQSKTALKNFVKFYNDVQNKQIKSPYECNISLDKDIVQLSGYCPAESSSELAKSKRFGVSAVPNIVVLYEGLIRKSKDEQGIMRVVGHELGHYYRSHASTPLSSLRYLYKLNASSDPIAPVQVTEESLIQLGAEVKALQGVSDRIDIPTAPLNPIIAWEAFNKREMEGGSFAQNCDSAACIQKWQELERFFSELNRDKQLSLEIGDVGNQQALFDYLAWQNIFSQALKLTKVSQTTPVSSIEVMSNRLLRSFIELTQKKIRETAWANLFELVSYVSHVYRDVAQKAGGIEKRLEKEGLGLYTEEQEADEIALEILTFLGISPKIAIEQMISTSEWGTLPSDIQDKKSCLERQSKKWKEKGRLKFEKMGSWSEPHHTNCFRIFNMHMEISAHKYENKISPIPRALNFKIPWSEFIRDKNIWMHK